ncbi:MAG: hypothetical protein JOZ51_13915 [Chloroflexi bacterium]|nr:hypothetical protein [Chloroflexota bacterium]
MTQHDLLTTLEDGLDTQRISPYLAAYIAAEVLNVDARSTGYDDRIRLDDTVEIERRLAPIRELV